MVDLEQQLWQRIEALEKENTTLRARVERYEASEIQKLASVRIEELVDMKMLQKMIDLFYETTGNVAGILDTNGNILAATPWQPICVEFHRKNSESKKRCIESDTYINEHLQAGTYTLYKCRNGLNDAAIPIFVQGQHLANFYFGQFFFQEEQTDQKYFEKQAEEFGFQKETYIEALQKVPRLQRKEFDKLMAFYTEFVNFISLAAQNNFRLNQANQHVQEANKKLEARTQKQDNSLQANNEKLRVMNHKLREVNEELLAEVQHRHQVEQDLRQSETWFRQMAENINSVFMVTDTQFRLLFVNQAFEKLFGRKQQDLQGSLHNIASWIEPKDLPALRKLFNQSKGKQINNYQFRIFRPDGSMAYLWAKSFLAKAETPQEKRYIFLVHDITAIKISEQKYRHLFENAGALIYTYSPHGRLLMINKKAASYTKNLPEDLVGKTVYETLPPELAQRQMKRIRDVVDSLQGDAYEHEFDLAGRKIVFLTASQPQFDLAGELIGVQFISQDITALKQSQEKVRKSEARWRRIIANTGQMLFRMLLPQGKYEFVSAAASAIFGFAPQKFYDQPGKIEHTLHPQWKKYYAQHKEKMLAGEPEQNMEYKIVTAKGEEKWIFQHNALIKNATGEAVAIEGVISDITRRKKNEEELRKYRFHLEQLVQERTEEVAQMNEELAVTNEGLNTTNSELKRTNEQLQNQIRERIEAQAELQEYKEHLEDLIGQRTQALRQSEALYRSLIEQAADCILVASPDEKIEQINRKAIELTGYSENEILGSKIQTLFGEISLQNTENKEFQLSLKSGKKVPVEMSYARVNDGRKQIIFRNIAERKKNEQELEHYRNHLEALVQERTEEVEQINAELKATNEELIDTNFTLEKQSKKLLASNQILEKQTKKLNKTLTDLRETQRRLLESEKMASLGQLTAGIAHEINNPINYISSGIDALKTVLEDIMEVIHAYDNISPENAQEMLENIAQLKEQTEFDELLKGLLELTQNIEVGVKRTTEIVRSLRSFSRADHEQFVETDLHESLNSTLIMLHNTYKNHVKIEKKYGDIPKIQCMAGKINQVLMNLISNAIQAIATQGKITIQTRQIEKTRPGAQEKENFVQVLIQDTGRGIPKNLQAKIFEPFFTTKDVGQGTGLGLSISYSIIEKHQGFLHMKSQPDQGTQFFVELPVFQKN